MPEKQTVYLYKEYCDSDAYGEELIMVFSEKESAKKVLKERFCEQNEVQSIEEFIRSMGENLDEMDTVSDDYISISTGNGCMYWVIETHDVLW